MWTEEEKQRARAALQQARSQTTTKPEMTWEEFDKISAEKEALNRLANTETPKEEGVFSKIGSALKTRGQDIYKTMKQTATGEINPLETGVRVVGDIVGGATDVAFEGLKAGAKAVLPEKAEQRVKQLGLDILQTDIGKAGVSALSKGVQEYEKWKEQNPRIAESLEGVLNIASILPAEKVLGVGAKVVKPAAKLAGEAVGEAATTAGKSLAKNVEKRAIDDVVNLVRKSTKEMTTAEKQELLKTGKASESILGGLKSKPSTSDYAIAEVAQGFVDPSKKVIENITSIKDGIRQKATSLVDYLRRANVPLDETNTLKKSISEAELPLVMKSDTAMKNMYDNVVEKFMEFTKDKKDMAGLLEARQQFDDWVETQIPSIWDEGGKYKPLNQAVTKMRQKVNDYIAENSYHFFPDTAQNPVRNILKEQSLLYEAVDNMAINNAKRIDKGLIERASSAIRSNPISSIVGAGAVGLSIPAMAGIISSPAAIAALTTYGMYRIGKKVITSEAIQKGLSEFLLKAGKTLNPEGKKAVQELADKLAEVNMSLSKKAGLTIEDVSEGGFKSPAVGQTADPIQEAKKYKSAEEFVEAQGKPIYHGTQGDFEVFAPKSPTEGLAGKAGTYFTTNLTEASGFGKNIKEVHISPNAKIKVEYANDMPAEIKAERIFQARREGYDAVQLKSVQPLRGNRAELAQVNKEINELKPKIDELNQRMLDGEITPEQNLSDPLMVKWSELLEKRNPTHTIVFNTDIIKTKSQLTDIWNKANRKPSK